MNKLLAAILLSFSFCCAPEIASEEEQINEILWAVIKDNPESFKNDCSLLTSMDGFLKSPSVVLSDDTVLAASLSDRLTEDEIADILFQKKNKNDLKLLGEKFAGKFRLIDKMEIQNLIDRVQASKDTSHPLDYWDEFEVNFECIQSFDFPLFTSDRKILVLRWAVICGPLCGGESTVLYKLKNGHWQEEAILESGDY